MEVDDGTINLVDSSSFRNSAKKRKNNFNSPTRKVSRKRKPNEETNTSFEDSEDSSNPSEILEESEDDELPGNNN